MGRSLRPQSRTYISTQTSPNRGSKRRLCTHCPLKVHRRVPCSYAAFVSQMRRSIRALRVCDREHPAKVGRTSATYIQASEVALDATRGACYDGAHHNGRVPVSRVFWGTSQSAGFLSQSPPLGRLDTVHRIMAPKIVIATHSQKTSH